MFSQAYVCPLGGMGACMAGGVCGGGMHGRGGMCGEGHMHGSGYVGKGDMHGGVCVAGDSHCSGRYASNWNAFLYEKLDSL